VIHRPVEEVFDFVADERNEPRYNPQMTKVELLTPEPIGSGTRFNADMSMLGRSIETTIEFTRYERPRLLASRSSSQPRDGRGKPMVTEGELTFSPVPQGTRMCWDWKVHTPGLLRAPAPIVGWMGRRQERRIWSELKRLLEQGESSAAG